MKQYTEDVSSYYTKGDRIAEEQVRLSIVSTHLSALESNNECS